MVLAEMNNHDLQEFIEAFDDFMKHFEAEELYYEGRMVYENHRAEAKRIQEQEIEALAEKYEVTVDYYMAEFM
jgi:hypothetical protein